MMTDEEKQRAYEQRRSKSRPAAMASYTTTEYRVWLPDGTTFTERAIGPSQIIAHYPNLIGLWVVQEMKPGMMGEMW